MILNPGQAESIEAFATRVGRAVLEEIGILVDGAPFREPEIVDPERWSALGSLNVRAFGHPKPSVHVKKNP